MTLVRLSQPENAPKGPPLVPTPSSIFVTLSGIATWVRLEHHWNVPHEDVSAPRFMVVMPLPMVMVARLGLPAKAPCPRLVTLSGMVTQVMLLRPVRLLWSLRFRKDNAPSPMLVTGKPSMVPGMTTFPPGPLYPVMVIVPLVLV